MRKQAIKSGALFVLFVLAISVESMHDGGKKVVIVLPYYKHEVQAIYFKEPSSATGPSNQEQYRNYMSSKPMGIKVWVEKPTPPGDRAKPMGYPNNPNSNNGAGYAGIQLTETPPASPAQWGGSQGGFSNSQPSGNQPGIPGNQSPWAQPEPPRNQPQWAGNQPGFSLNDPPNPGSQSGFSGDQPPWTQPGITGINPPSPGNQPGFSGLNPPRPGNQAGFSGDQTPWSQPGYSGNNPQRPGNQPGFSGNGPQRPGTQPGFSGNGPPRPGNQPGFSGNGPPRPGTQSGFSGNGPQRPGTQPGFSGGDQPQWSQPEIPGNNPPRPGTQPGFSDDQPPWSVNQNGDSGSQTPWTGLSSGFPGNEPPRIGNQPGFSSNQPGFSSNQPGFSSNPPGFSSNEPGFSSNQPGFSSNLPPWSSSQTGVSGTNFQSPQNEGNGFNKPPGGGGTRPTESFPTSWSSIKVFPANQGKPSQTSTNFNSQNSRWPTSSAGKNGQDWNVGWKSTRPQQGGGQQPSDDAFFGGRSFWESQGGLQLPGGDEGWQFQSSPANNAGWQSQGSQTGGPTNGNGNAWNQDVNGRGSNGPDGRWETQSQQEWEKSQQGGTSNSYTPPESPASWRDDTIVLDQQQWPKPTSTSSTQGWAAANEVNDGLRGGCPPGGGGNNCFRGANNGVRVRNNHQAGYDSEKPADGVIGGWNGPLQNGEGNAVNNFDEISFKSGKSSDIFAQRENSFGGSGFATNSNPVKGVAINLNAVGSNNNYRLRESQGASSNFALGDNRSNRNGKYEFSDDAEIFVGQDSYGVSINHGKSDFYKNSRNTDIVSGGKFPPVDSYSSASFNGVNTLAKTTKSDKEKRGKETDFGVAGEFGKKLKDGAKRLKKAGADDLSTS